MISILMNLWGVGLSQPTAEERAFGIMDHDFSFFSKLNVEGKGKVEFEIICDGEGSLTSVKLLRNDLTSQIEKICGDELYKLKFIAPSNVLPSESYKQKVTYRFKNRFRSFSLSTSKLIVKN